MGKLAYCGPLEQLHGLQTWTVVLDPSITTGLMNVLKVSEQMPGCKRKKGKLLRFCVDDTLTKVD